MLVSVMKGRGEERYGSFVYTYVAEGRAAGLGAKEREPCSEFKG
jgi:hypothetical protein